MSAPESDFESPKLTIKTFNPVYELGHVAFGVLSRYKYDLKIKGLQNFPGEGPVLLGPIHRSETDPYVVGVALNRPVNFMQKKELETLQYFYLGYLTRLTGAFPVDRNNPQPSTLKHAKRLLQKGKVVGIFGEGTRYADEKSKTLLGDEVGPLLDSIGWLAVTSDSPISPMGIGTAYSAENNKTVKRIVLAEPILKQAGLKKNDAIKVMMSEFGESLQQAFDEAADAAAREV